MRQPVLKFCLEHVDPVGIADECRSHVDHEIILVSVDLGIFPVASALGSHCGPVEDVVLRNVGYERGFRSGGSRRCRNGSARLRGLPPCRFCNPSSARHCALCSACLPYRSCVAAGGNRFRSAHELIGTFENVPRRCRSWDRRPEASSDRKHPSSECRGGGEPGI